MNKENCFIRYTNEDISINVYFRNGKYWVSINDIAIIFNKSRQTIKRYISDFNLDVNEHHLHIKAHQIDIIYLGHKTKYYDCQIVTEILKFLPSPIAEDFIKWTRNNPSNTEENEYKIITCSNNNVTIDAAISPDEVTAWLTQEQIANLYQTTVANINQHITNIYDDGELNNGATIKKYLKVQFEGKRQVIRVLLKF